jgi:hypothetical protein
MFPTYGGFDWQWIQLPDLAKETHRCFSFGLEGKIYVIGGFGHSLMNVQVINGSEETIITHDLMKHVRILNLSQDLMLFLMI